MALHFKKFQEQAIDAGFESLRKENTDLIVMPTGSGKSVVIAGLLERLKPASNQRVLILSHAKEILEQNANVIARHLPNLPLGINCAGLGRRELGREVTLASVHSLYRRPNINWNWRKVLIDEAHTISRSMSSMYGKCFSALHRPAEGRRRRASILGLTATPYRLDSGYLHKGPGALFRGIAYEVSVSRLVSMGVLSPLTTEPVSQMKFTISTERQVEKYTEIVEDWMMETSICINQMLKYAKHRKKWLIFCCTIRHAVAAAQMLNANGISVGVVHSEQRKSEREEVIRQYRMGQLRAVVNVNVLTTGFDVPDIDCIGLIRPTLSTGLYVQMLGRGMRKNEGKQDCLLLDFAGNIARHGPLTEITPYSFKPPVGDGQGAKDKECPQCTTKLAIMVRQCPECNHLFSKLETFASQADVMEPAETKYNLVKKVPVSNSEYLATEEVATLLDMSVAGVKGMRTAKTGPTFYVKEQMTSLGLRHIVYRKEDVLAWRRSQRKTSR